MGHDLTAEELEVIDHYLQKKLSDAEIQAFEERLGNETEFREAFLIQKQAYLVLNESEWGTISPTNDQKELDKYRKLLRSEELQKSSASIRSIGQEFTAETKQPNRFRIGAIAAALVTLITVTAILWGSEPTLPELYAENVAWQNLNSFVEKGTNNSAITNGTTYFKNEQYEQALNSFNAIGQDDPFYAISLIYRGACYDRLGDTQNAIATFEELTVQSNSLEFSKGYWYLAMMYLKLDDREKAIEYLSISAGNSEYFNYTKARSLLKELE